VAKKRLGKPKTVDERDQYRVVANQICSFLTLDGSSRWLTPFNPAFLNVYHRLGRQLVQHSNDLTEKNKIRRVDVPAKVLHTVFAMDREDHAFLQDPLRWGFGLTEPMATKTLARLLSAGSGELRARRISAFLQSIGLKEGCASLDALEHCRVIAEQDRIDLKLVWPDREGRDVIVIIEAKFGHKVTKGQLIGYWNAVAHLHGSAPFAGIVLSLSDKNFLALEHEERDEWRQVDWRAFWLRFERLRPLEHDPSLRQFLSTLWHRSGCLTQEDRYGRI